MLQQNIIQALKLTDPIGTPIYFGETNLAHMLKNHPVDYAKYGQYLSLILSEPDYIGRNPKDQSLEYIKEFLVEQEYVKVAVRVSQSGSYYARSLYALNRNRVNNFIANGSLIPLTKTEE